jgi:hypothetical protein
LARWLPAAFGLSLNQREVDFVIPRLDADLPLCIDPFLLYKSRRSELIAAHETLVGLFNEAFAAFRAGDSERAARLIYFPEVQEIRFGYARNSVAGRGMGTMLSRLVIETLQGSPALVERGLRHVEELQLFSTGIAEDRISDLAANAIKQFLVSYTQNQCNMWGIPTVDSVPLEHIWSAERHDWIDDYVSLPIDPETRLPVLLVPRWIVRRLPWINYEDFFRTDLTAFLRSRLPGSTKRGPVPKPEAIELTRAQVGLVDTYVKRKERDAQHARPDPPPLLAESPDECESLVDQVVALPVGRDAAYSYQRLILQLLNCLFEPELVDGEAQSRTASGVEIRDLVFANNSDLPFLRYLLTNHGNLLVVFECKNVAKLDPDDINQLANYLGDPMGRCGFIVTRQQPHERILAKIRATYSKDHPRKVLLVLTDNDLRVMTAMRRDGSRHPVDHLQRKYRELVQSIE